VLWRSGIHALFGPRGIVVPYNSSFISLLRSVCKTYNKMRIFYVFWQLTMAKLDINNRVPAQVIGTLAAV
jgi:hypothetical protein